MSRAARLLDLRLAAQRGDEDLERAAEDALAKIAAMLPDGLEDMPDTPGLLAGPRAGAPPHLGVLRAAMRAERTLRLRYTDRNGAAASCSPIGARRRMGRADGC